MPRKCFTIYVSVYNTHPPFRAQIGGGKSADYTWGKTVSVWNFASNNVIHDVLNKKVNLNSQLELLHFVVSMHLSNHDTKVAT